MRPPREDYVRVTCQWRDCTVEPAVEYRDGDDFADVAALLKNVVQGQCDVPDRFADEMMIARILGACIGGMWPDRAYFVEVWQDGKEGFAQVFQPFGVPRNA